MIVGWQPWEVAWNTCCYLLDWGSHFINMAHEGNATINQISIYLYIFISLCICAMGLTFYALVNKCELCAWMSTKHDTLWHHTTNNMRSAPWRLCEEIYNVTLKALDIVLHCKAFVLKLLTGSRLGLPNVTLNVYPSFYKNFCQKFLEHLERPYLHHDEAQPAVKLAC